MCARVVLNSSSKRKRRRREEDAADSAIQCALRERAHLLAMRRLDACPGAADTVERARTAARARRAAVAGLDDRLRATHRAAIMADHAVLRDMHEGVQREAQAYAARIRQAARARRAMVLAGRQGGGGNSRGEYERRIQMLLMGETPPRRSRVRAAADVAAANSGPIGTHGLHSGEDKVHRSSADARTASPLPPHYAD